MNSISVPRSGLPRAVASVALALSVGLPALAGATPPVQLVETRPIETTLGNAALPSAHDVWLEMIRGAQHSLDFEEFYLSTWPSEPMDDVLAAIGAAASRGVTVRLILDAGMHRTYPTPADSLGRVHGITVRTLDMHAIAGGIQHSKYFIVDGAQMFLGSQNLDWRALEHIHELGVRVSDRRLAGVFARVFEMDWLSAAGDSLAAQRMAGAQNQHDGLPIRIAQAPGDTVKLWPSYTPQHFIPDTALWDRDALVRLLDSARFEIVVQSLTESAVDRRERDDALEDALRRAAARGVRVRLVISDWETDSPALAGLQQLSTVPGIEIKLSTVPEWSGGYIPFARVEHCKYAVVDTLRTWVGTSNWEPSYFHGSRNVAVTMENRAIATDARRVFEVSWNSRTAAPVRADAKYAPKVHGSTPPPGKKVYGQ